MATGWPRSTGNISSQSIILKLYARNSQSGTTHDPNKQMTSPIHWACPLQGHIPLPGQTISYKPPSPPDLPERVPSLLIFPSLYTTSTCGPCILSQQRDCVVPNFLVGKRRVRTERKLHLSPVQVPVMDNQPTDEPKVSINRNGVVRQD